MSTTIGPGSTFAGYHLEALVARGGMGVVFGRAIRSSSAGSR